MSTEPCEVGYEMWAPRPERWQAHVVTVRPSARDETVSALAMAERWWASHLSKLATSGDLRNFTITERVNGERFTYSPDELDGGWVGQVRDASGCWSQGDDVEGCAINLRHARSAVAAAV
jgi:hypothetical protein